MINFSIKLTSVIAITGLSASLAFAQPTSVKMTVDCPAIGTGVDAVKNYVTSFAGIGTERVNGGAPNDILFQGPILLGWKIPSDLVAAGYFNDGVSYGSDTGIVRCKYSSTLGYTSFSISHSLVNSLGGSVASSTNEDIHLKLPIGLR